MSEIAPRQPKPPRMPAAPITDSLVNFVAMALRDPSIDATKLEALLRMQREIVADDARLQYSRAMSAAQGEMQPVVRDALNTQTSSKYARLETIDAMIRPIYTQHGFALEFNSEPMAGQNVMMVCEVSHTAGHAKQYRLPAALDITGPLGKANKTPLHGLGSTVTYLRRYLTLMIFNIALRNEDNDGNREQRHAPTIDGGDGEIISRAQATELHQLLAECSANPKATVQNARKFLDKMGMQHIKTLADAPPAEFARLRTALNAKRARIAATNTQTGVAA